jgi:hypothetical protein
VIVLGNLFEHLKFLPRKTKGAQNGHTSPPS